MVKTLFHRWKNRKHGFSRFRRLFRRDKTAEAVPTLRDDVTTRRSHGIGIAMVIGTLLLLGAGVAGAADVSAKIEPDRFPADRAGQLSVTVSGGSFDSPPSPAVPDGVTIRPYGQSRNVQIINGRMTQSLTQNYIVAANQPGEYTIPPFEVKVNGQTVTTDPVKFTVTAGNAPVPAPGGQSPPAASGSDSTGSAPASLGFLRLDFPKRSRDHLYVGEMAPVRITAYFPADVQVSLRSAPRPEGQGFTLNNLSEEPKQGSAELNGQTWRTVTWFAGISMAKAGEYPIAVSLDATVMVREKSNPQRSRPRSPFGGRSLFDDPFFDDFLNNAFTRTIPREVTLTSPGDPLEVRSLPQEGRPERFSGAVGQFSLGSFQLPADATTGEPQKIRVTVNGKGNFNRMEAPSLEPADAWKTYTPRTEFTSGDDASFSGHKTFEFSAVPQKAGEQKTRLAFSYFDPETAKYETVNSPEISLKVAGEDVKPMPPTVASGEEPAPPAGGDSTSEQAAGESHLAPPRLGSTVAVGTLEPLIYDPAYRIAVGLALAGIAGGFVIGAFRRKHGDPARMAARESQKNERAALSDAAAAAQRGDAGLFFAAARRALQVRLGARWNRSPEAITLAEARRHLPADSTALAIFRQADTVAYAPAGSGTGEELNRWNEALLEALEDIGDSSSGSANSADAS